MFLNEANIWDGTSAQEDTTTVTATALDVFVFLNESFGQLNDSQVFVPEPSLGGQIQANSSIEFSVLLLQGPRRYILDGCLLVSAVSLVVSFVVYCTVPELRTVPGKCLMGLIVSELITDLLVIAAMHHSDHRNTLSCTVIGVCLHYFFLTIVSWTNVIAFDIFKKFKYPNQKLRHFVRYIFYVYLAPLAVVLSALALDFVSFTSNSLLRPRYGERICGMSSPAAKLLFLTIPINLSLIVNVVIFLTAIYKIRKVVHEISASSAPLSTSMRKRCMWYAKLSLLLGISSMFGFFGIQLPCCQWVKFVTFMLNSMHGLFIFIAFTCKRSTFRLFSKHILVSGLFRSLCSMKRAGGVFVSSLSGRSTKNTSMADNKSCAISPDSSGKCVRPNSVRSVYRGTACKGSATLVTTTTITTSSTTSEPNSPNHQTPEFTPGRINTTAVTLHSASAANAT